MQELAVPSLPMHDVADTRHFYEALGFICVHEQPPPDTFLIMMMRTVQIHFFEHRGVNQHANYAGCLILAPHIEALHLKFHTAFPDRILPIENKPWGTREFAFHDPCGNLIRIQEQTFNI